MAIKLYEDGIVGLVKAAHIAKMPVESFLNKLALLDIDTVDLTDDELDYDLKALDE